MVKNLDRVFSHTEDRAAGASPVSGSLAAFEDQVKLPAGPTCRLGVTSSLPQTDRAAPHNRVD
ncbi:hypothetical protein INR49_020555 [Caranx melampygus]|nr:hypothetical protein INR49_020555 [Caranx melampygus]